ncbi:MAG: hypothetical protein RLZZ206_2565 [Cyanobacteriota bacterium]|jgi:hypothetical protein
MVSAESGSLQPNAATYPRYPAVNNIALLVFQVLQAASGRRRLRPIQPGG